VSPDLQPAQGVKHYLFLLLGLSMKQKKLLRRLYQACLDHNEEELSKLRREEFCKIFKHRDKNKHFSPKWTIVNF
jgi:hypothetical protein